MKTKNINIVKLLCKGLAAAGMSVFLGGNALAATSGHYQLDGGGFQWVGQPALKSRSYEVATSPISSSSSSARSSSSSVSSSSSSSVPVTTEHGGPGSYTQPTKAPAPISPVTPEPVRPPVHPAASSASSAGSSQKPGIPLGGMPAIVPGPQTIMELLEEIREDPVLQVRVQRRLEQRMNGIPAGPTKQRFFERIRELLVPTKRGTTIPNHGAETSRLRGFLLDVQSFAARPGLSFVDDLAIVVIFVLLSVVIWKRYRSSPVFAAQKRTRTMQAWRRRSLYARRTSRSTRA